MAASVMTLAIGAALPHSVFAASSTWLATPTDANWPTTTDWTLGVVPGATGGSTTNTDTATFNQTDTTTFGLAANPVIIDSGRNIGSITFDTAAASPYVIGTTGGNALLLTNGGTIQTTSTVANIETVNAPLTLEPVSSTTSGSYTFSSNSSTAADVLTFGGAITTGTSAATETLNLNGTNTGSNLLSGVLSDSGTSGYGIVVSKAGAGAWTLGGSGVSALTRATFVVSAGTLNFGAAANAPTVTTSNASGYAFNAPNNSIVYVNGGTFSFNNGTLTTTTSQYGINLLSGAVNVGGGSISITATNSGVPGFNDSASAGNGTINVSGGSISVTASQGLVLSGSQTYNQSGGTFSTNGRIEFSNLGGSSIVNVSGGTLSASNDIESVRGTTTYTLSGTGNIITPTLDLTTAQLSGGAAASIFNLNGGILLVGQIILGTNGTTGGGTFNFNGGTLSSSASSAAFMTGLTSANVLAGGAIINTNANNDTIAQNLLTGASPDGGLAKWGSGSLNLSGANTFIGPVTINTGTLQLGSASALGGSSGATVVSGAVLDLNGFTPTTSIPLKLSGTGVSSNGVLVNNNATAATYAGAITLGNSSVSIVANSGALVTTGAITTTSNSAVDTLTLGGTGTGGNDVQSTLSDAGSGGFGLLISKTGAGSWTLGGNSASSLARGNIQGSGGTLSFGSATEAPTLTTATVAAGSPNGAELFLNGGTFNMANGTLTMNATTSGAVGVYVNSVGINISGGTLTANSTQGLVLNSATYSQSGGTFTTNGIIEFANAAAASNSTVNISGGNLTTTSANGADATDLAVRGTTTVNLSGTGVFTTPILNMTTNQTSAVGTASTFNLGAGAGTGGTLVVGTILNGTNTSTGARTFNFNGGTLSSSLTSATFMQGLTNAYVQAGGAVINTNAFNDTIAQSLLTNASPDGGLTKYGTAVLTLSGTNTYNGATTINAGTLTIDSTTNTGAALTSTSLVTVASGATLRLISTVGGTTTLINDSAVINVAGTNAIALNLAGGTENVQLFEINGVAQPVGTYSATGGTAGTADDSYFVSSGNSGFLNVTATPEPSSMVLLAMGGFGLLSRRRRRNRGRPLCEEAQLSFEPQILA